MSSWALRWHFGLVLALVLRPNAARRFSALRPSAPESHQAGRENIRDRSAPARHDRARRRSPSAADHAARAETHPPPRLTLPGGKPTRPRRPIGQAADLAEIARLHRGFGAGRPRRRIKIHGW